MSGIDVFLLKLLAWRLTYFAVQTSSFKHFYFLGNYYLNIRWFCLIKKLIIIKYIHAVYLLNKYLHNCYNMLNFCLNLLFINYKSNQLLLLGQCLQLCLLLRLLLLLLSVFSWAALASPSLSLTLPLPLHNNAPTSVWSCWVLSFISYAPLLYSLIIFFRLFVIVSFGDMHRHTHTHIHTRTHQLSLRTLYWSWVVVCPSKGGILYYTYIDT